MLGWVPSSLYHCIELLSQWVMSLLTYVKEKQHLCNAVSASAGWWCSNRHNDRMLLLNHQAGHYYPICWASFIQEIQLWCNQHSNLEDIKTEGWRCYCVKIHLGVMFPWFWCDKWPHDWSCECLCNEAEMNFCFFNSPYMWYKYMLWF